MSHNREFMGGDDLSSQSGPLILSRIRPCKTVALITEKNPITAAVAGLVRRYLKQCGPWCSVTLHSLISPIHGAFDILLQPGVSPLACLLLSSSPQDAESPAFSKAQRMPHISVSQDNSSRMHPIFPFSLNIPLPVTRATCDTSLLDNTWFASS